MQKTVLNWWWLFLLAGLVIPLGYWAAASQPPPPFAFSTGSYVSGLNPAAPFAEAFIIMLVLTLAFKNIHRITSGPSEKITYAGLGLLFMALIYFSLHNLLYPRHYPIDNARHYISIADTFDTKKTLLKRYDLYYFLIILIFFLYFFIINFPTPLPKKNP